MEIINKHWSEGGTGVTNFDTYPPNETQRPLVEAESFPRDPLAKSMADLVTPKQLGLIHALAREVGVDKEEECQSVLRCKTDELSKRAASSFIDHLNHIKKEAMRTA